MTNLTQFTTLTFDCYGTLIDWERGILAELRPWVERQGRGDLTDTVLLERFGTVESEVETERPSSLYPEVLAEVHGRLAREWGLRSSAEDAAGFGGSVGRWPAFADSASGLQYLKRYYKLVILSNVDRASFARSNQQLAVEFDRVLTAQDIGSYKPSLRNFEYALEALGRDFGTAKTDILHTAQSLFHDIVPARTLGLATLWVNRRKAVGGWGATPAPAAPGALTRPDFEVASLTELVKLHQAHLRGETA